MLTPQLWLMLLRTALNAKHPFRTSPVVVDSILRYCLVSSQFYAGL